jgi:hypothetical protein
MQKVKKVTSFETLELEVARLRKRTRQLEHELAGRVDFFKDNYGKMALNSVIPGVGKHKGTFGMVSRIAGIAWQSGKFKNFATGALMTVLEFVGVRLGINLFNKYQQHRRKKRTRKKAEKSSHSGAEEDY